MLHPSLPSCLPPPPSTRLFKGVISPSVVPPVKRACTHHHAPTHKHFEPVILTPLSPLNVAAHMKSHVCPHSLKIVVLVLLGLGLP